MNLKLSWVMIYLKQAEASEETTSMVKFTVIILQVMSHLKRTFTRSSGCCVSHMDYKPGVSTTQMMSLSRESRSHSINKNYIPMRAVNGNK